MPDTGLTFDLALRRAEFQLHVALSVRPGETLVLVGPSGAGKSTCLLLVAGLLAPDTGSVRCGDEVWCDVERGLHLRPERRRVGMLFQDYALFPHLSVRENVGYGPRACGQSRAQANAASATWIVRLGLAGLEDRDVGTISGGQRQRVALARALAAEPSVLLLDEPFGSLDVTTRGLMRSELRAFLASVGLPAILVTHDPVDALAFGDRIAVLENGAVTQVGPRDQLVFQPRSRLVADLVGLNLYRVLLAAGEGLKEARADRTLFHVLADGLAGPAFLAFAPSEVALATERWPGSAQNVFAGHVIEVLALGDRVRVVLDVGVVLVAEVTRQAAEGLAVVVGRRLWAAIKATAIRVYA